MGIFEGDADGFDVGRLLGPAEGLLEGAFDLCLDGELVGKLLGFKDAVTLGEDVGCKDNVGFSE